MKWISQAAVLFLVIMLARVSYAETVYFKDGTKIKGRLMEKSDYYIVIEQNNRPRKYYLDLINNIEEDIVDVSVSQNIDTDKFLYTAETKVEWILKLMDVNGTRDSLKNSIATILEKAPEERKKEMEQIFNLDGLIEKLIPIFDEHYTENEIKEIVLFYESPTGQKMIKISPELMKQVSEATIRYFGERAQK